MMKQMNMVSRLGPLGLIIVLLVFMGFALWTTMITLMLSTAVREAVSVNDLYARAYDHLGAEESLAREYRVEPSLDVRGQYQVAAAALVKDLLTASSKEVGDPEEDQHLVARVLSEHQRSLLATAQLFAAVDTGEKAKALALDRNTSGPLFEQMEQHVDGLVNEHSQEDIRRLAELYPSQQKSFRTTPIVFTICLVLPGG